MALVNKFFRDIQMRFRGNWWRKFYSGADDII